MTLLIKSLNNFMNQLNSIMFCKMPKIAAIFWCFVFVFLLCSPVHGQVSGYMGKRGLIMAGAIPSLNIAEYAMGKPTSVFVMRYSVVGEYLVKRNLAISTEYTLLPNIGGRYSLSSNTSDNIVDGSTDTHEICLGITGKARLLMGRDNLLPMGFYSNLSARYILANTHFDMPNYEDYSLKSASINSHFLGASYSFGFKGIIAHSFIIDTGTQLAYQIKLPVKTTDDPVLSHNLYEMSYSINQFNFNSGIFRFYLRFGFMF